MALETGTRVGLYEIQEQLGRGGMATVFKARHTVLERDAALKFLDLAFLDDPEFVKRFRHEARVIAALDHPNIVPVFDFSEHEGLPYLVMKFVEGETLKARLGRGRLSLADSAEIIQSIGSGLAYAHQQGVLHRDVKPSNVLIGAEGSIYLADFGLARIAASAQSTLSREFMIGTPQYISPEQARSEPDLDARTDIYSFGILVYELLVGQVPFDADTPISIIHDHMHTPPPRPSAKAPGILEELDCAILRALAKDKKDRFGTVNEMVQAIGEAMAAVWPSGTIAAKAPAAAGDQHPAEILPTGSPQPTIPDHEAETAKLEELEQAVLVCPEGPFYPLQADRLLIGRKDPRRGISPEIDLTEAEPHDPKTGTRRRTVHREQAWIHRRGTDWAVEIVPGTEDRAQLNGQPMEAGREYPLQNGDHLQFGAVELVLQMHAD